MGILAWLAQDDDDKPARRQGRRSAGTAGRAQRGRQGARRTRAGDRTRRRAKMAPPIRGAGGLTYRAPWEGTGYAAWLRALKTSRGAYVIADAETGQVLYVGESRTGSLYSTITRHFQRWSSVTNKTWDRDKVRVAVATTTTQAAAVRQQNRWICELGPNENEVRPGCAERVPF